MFSRLCGALHNITVNTAKTFIMSVGHNLVKKPIVFIAIIANQSFERSCKYVGVTFFGRTKFVVDVTVIPVKRKCYVPN
jgi:hypothetical protein